ncbi:MAG: glycosyltransferase family 4 protein [Acidobacteriota bacterium]
MRVVLITPGFAADEADWCIPAVTTLVRGLAARHEVRVFALRYPFRSESYQIAGARVRAFGGAHSGGIGRLVLLRRAYRHLVTALEQEPCDVVHGLWADEPGRLAVAVARCLGTPAVVSLLGGELVGIRDIRYGAQLSLLGRGFVRTALRRAEVVTVGSSFLGRLAARSAGARLRLAALGVDTTLFQPTDAASPLVLSGRPPILHVASLAPVKDQAMLLRAFGRLLRDFPAACLHVIGDGPARGQVVSRAADLGMAGSVHFHGSVAHHLLPAYYRAASFCVLSSRFESQGMVVLEAAACSRTTVGPEVGVLPELVPAVVTVPAGDDEALAAAMADLSRDPEHALTLGRDAMAMVRSSFDLATCLSRFEAIYGAVGPRAAAHA